MRELPRDILNDVNVEQSTDGDHEVFDSTDLMYHWVDMDQ